MAGSAKVGAIGYPPRLDATTGRTHCEACGEKLEQQVKHVCRGNERFHDAPRNADTSKEPRS
jgi:hypothetical protein